MDWTTIITTALTLLIPSGILGSVVFYRENKRGKQLENEAKVIVEWQGIADMYKSRCEELKATVDAKDEKIEELYRNETAMREKLDKLSSKNAVLEIFKCRDISCDKRKPPLSNSKVVANIVDSVE